MSATVRKLRYPSSGPFLGAAGSGPPPEVGDGTPGIVYRFNGDSAGPQTWPNAGPNVLNMLFDSYDGTPGDASPAFPTPIQGPCWLDFEVYLPWIQLGTTNVTPILFMTHQFAEGQQRFWSQYACGNSQMCSQTLTQRLIWLPGPTFTWLSFRLNIEAVADAGDVILDNPRAYAKFTVYRAPDGV